ncbi:MAG: monovalent cation/H(+) antiporter subunit G [Planctomycetota bacterium]
MTGLEITGCIFLGFGCFLALTGAVGVLRMPDFFSRIHPAGKSDTLAQTLILIGLLLGASHDFGTTVKLLMITGLLYLTAPTATHAITQAAYHDIGESSADSEPSDTAPHESNGGSPA